MKFKIELSKHGLSTVLSSLMTCKDTMSDKIVVGRLKEAIDEIMETLKPEDHD